MTPLGNTDHFPRISVIMPSLNQAAYLEESICSVLDQNYRNLEFMILDGGSTDGSREIIERYSDRLSYYHSKPDKGQADALIQGFARATGSLMGWVNSDDVLLPGALRQIGQAFLSDPQIGIFGGNYVLIDHAGCIIRCKRHPKQSASFGRHGLFAVNQPGSFFTRRAYEAVEGLHIDLHYVMDTDLYVRMMINGCQYLHVNAWLSGFRKHPAAKTISQTVKAHQEHERVRHECWPPMRFRRIWAVSYITWQILNGNYIRMGVETLLAQGKHWRVWSSHHCW